MDAYSNLSDFDIFFFYGEPGGDLDMEIQADILSGLTQPARQMFYNNNDGAGIVEKENNPISLVLQIGLRVNIVNWVSFRNTEVTDGTNGTPDRRVAISQNSISIDSDDTGNLQIMATYLAFKDSKKPKTVTVPLTLQS
jgi:hypothetical protein